MTVGEPRLYLDYNASAPLLPAAREALTSALDAANPSSVHADGRRARTLVEAARRSIAELLSCESDAVIFTSGASEAAATILSPHWLVDGKPAQITKLAVLDTDHACVREGGSLPVDAITRLPVKASGHVDETTLARWAASLGDDDAGLLTVSHANAETGVLQPLDRIREAIAGRQILFAVDCAQSAGRVPVAVPVLSADLLFVSGHKMGAMKGIGAMVVRDPSTRPMPLIGGGGQESGRRAGTLAVPLIASFGAAASDALTRLARTGDDLFEQRAYLEAALLRDVVGARVLGADVDRLPNTVCVAVPGVSAETAQMALDLDGIAVSAGSACSSGKIGRSHVVEAMVRGGLDIAPDDGAVRGSFGHDTTIADLDRFVAAFARVCARVSGGNRAARAA